MITKHSDPFLILQKENHTTAVYPFYTDLPVIQGSVVVLHGMAEHHERYYPFADFLNRNGFDVYLYDHRGHGVDKSAEQLGFFAEKNGDRLVVSDAIQVLKHVKAQGRSDRLVLFGHSMGSLIARNVIQHYDEMDCAIICGTTMPPSLVSLAGYKIASLLCSLQGPRHYSPFLDRLLFSGPQYKKLCTRTSNDWLTRDAAIVSAYNQDPFCGFLCTTSFYRDLIHLTFLAGKKELIAETRKDLPIFLISGDNDPVGGCGSQVKSLFKLLNRLGFEKVTLKLYPDARHEILNEPDHEVVMSEIVSWLLHQNVK
ncbi:MAG: alpha/beta hydrolase [Lachnospiraceae bacterium]|nr:alpha/beta hydrolase [Lachnospiraceae bacterium]